MSQNRIVPNTNSGYGYSHSATNIKPSPPDHGMKSQPTFVMSNGMVVSNGHKSDHMETMNDEFTSRFEDSSNWTNGSHGGTSSAPWSLPFLSNSMSALLPLQSSLHLRQRNENSMNVHQHHQHPYEHYQDVHTGHHVKFMAQNRDRYNTDSLYVPSIGSHKKCYSNGDHYDDGDDSDPIPISDIFDEPKSNRNGSWDTSNVPPRYANRAHMIRSTSIVSLQPAYNNSITSPQDQRSYIRRVSNFNEEDHHHSSNGGGSSNHHTSPANDEILSMAGSLTTIEMNEFHHIQNDSSDTLTIVAAEHTISASSSSSSLVGGGDDGDIDDTSNKNKSADSVVVIAVDDISKNTTVDAAISFGICCSISGGSSTCSDDPDCGSSIHSGILYNDLCLSPLWCTGGSTESSPEYPDPFYHDGSRSNYESMIEMPQLQMPFF